MNLLDKLRAAVGIRNREQKIYNAGVLPRPVEGLAKYPPKAFAGEEGIYAYRLWLMVTDASSVIACIRDQFPSVGSEVHQRGIHQGSNGESISLAIYPEFKGTAVRLLTNSLNLLRAIDALHFTQPPPWVVFPHIDPDTLGSMQGDIDFWWLVYWGPFWSAASASERAEYMLLHKPSKAWIEYFAFRDSWAET